MEKCRTILTPHVPPFKVTQGYWTDTDRSAAYDFLLVILSNHGPISYRLRDKRRFLSKIANIPTAVCLTSHWGSYPWNF